MAIDSRFDLEATSRLPSSSSQTHASAGIEPTRVDPPRPTPAPSAGHPPERSHRVPLAQRRTLSLLSALMLAGAAAHAQVLAIMYHAHPNLGYDRNNFRDHMDFFVQNGFHSITMDQFYDWHQFDAPLPLRPVLLTVDDNYILGYTEMYPIFAERGLVAINYTHTQGIGIGAPKASWEQVREMDAAGVFLLESHSRTHPDLTTRTAEQLVFEIAGSKQDILTLGGKVSHHFCYPYGRYNQDVINACIAAGYRTAITTNPGLNYRTTPLFELVRFGGDGKTLDQLKATIGFANYPPPPPGPGWILDDADPHAYYDPARWTLSTSPTGFHGAGNRVRAAGSSGVMRWAAILPQTGRMAVHARWTSNSTRASDALYVVRNLAGDSEIVVDQRAGGGQWVELGVFDFAEGQPVEVLLGAGTSGTLSADALWFEPRTPQPTSSLWVIH
jgi:peptidoglycan/xylan/chitin deacetylase (PgdA/CDA1 family)